MLCETRLKTSMESFESGIFEFEDLDLKATMNIGDTIEAILIDAQKTNRLVCGLNNASNYLKECDTAERSLFFFIAPSVNGDSITHMQEVFLQAFCFENDIYIIKLDEAAKLSRILGFEGLVTCALTQKIPQSHGRRESHTELEKVLIDHCENFWDELIQPIIKLPEK